MKRIFFLCCIIMCSMDVYSQQNDTVKTSSLPAVTIKTRRIARISRMSGAENSVSIGQAELFRAACCNLGESFVNNASVDVNYNDAAMGTRQIKLLGLSGQYVQMLNEGLPASTGAASPYLLSYVPGAWMKSISVSKGASSVKNGPQSITGQINVEYLKPEDEPTVMFNIFGDSRLKTELNAAVNRHLNNNLSTVLMAHYEHDFAHHDDDGDLWHDSPSISQFHLQNRWKYTNGRYIMHAGAGYLQQSRLGGQMSSVNNPYIVSLNANRTEAYMKHAFLLNKEHNTNIAFLANGTLHSLDGSFGHKNYTNSHLSFNSRLVLEHDFNPVHNLSTGFSLNGDSFDEQILMLSQRQWQLQDYVPGVYAQYTFAPSYRLTAMAGLRADYSSLYDRCFVTPRLHLKLVTTDWMTLRLSSGKGFRTTHPFAENHYLLASGRTLVSDSILPQEEAWNSGLSMDFNFSINEKKLKISAEYYYTNFIHQSVVDYDSDPSKIIIADLSGNSFSHTAQMDVSFDFSDELNILSAFRYNYVRCSYGGLLLEKPLQSRYKGLVTLNWKPMMALWQFDITLSLNGGGRMPKPYLLADGSPSWDEEFPAYLQLGAQVTREFRHFSVYFGGENLTNYRQPDPIINANNPWSNDFEPTLIWGPIHGIMAYAGIRLKLVQNHSEK